MCTGESIVLHKDQECILTSVLMVKKSLNNVKEELLLILQNHEAEQAFMFISIHLLQISACRWTLTHDTSQQCHNCVHVFFLDASGSTEQNLILQQDHIGSFLPTFTLKGQDMNWGNVWPRGTFFVFWCKQGFPFSCFWQFLNSICFFSLQIKTQTLFYGIKTALFFSPSSHHLMILLSCSELGKKQSFLSLAEGSTALVFQDRNSA